MRKIVLLGVALATLFASDTDSTDKEAKFIGARGKYWAFQNVVRPAVPAVSDPWVRTPIDAFIIDALTAKKLTPSEPVDRIRLIRRVTFDLIGLPPTPAEVDAFLRDRSPDAYREGRGPAARFPALWRAVGAEVARRGAIRRDQRFRIGCSNARTPGATAIM